LLQAAPRDPGESDHPYKAWTIRLATRGVCPRRQLHSTSRPFPHKKGHENRPVTVKSFVRLTTSEIESVVSVHLFQFGTVPAPPKSFALLLESVPPRKVAEDVFVFDPQMEIPQQQTVRFDIRFEVNVHNSAFLQICLDPGPVGNQVRWRWAAPIGYTGVWSSSEQQASWFDDSVDYCINIDGADTTIVVSLMEHVGTPHQQCPFIPPQSAVGEMIRSTR
jgi:hypothetical protein